MIFGGQFNVDQLTLLVPRSSLLQRCIRHKNKAFPHTSAIVAARADNHSNIQHPDTEEALLELGLTDLVIVKLTEQKKSL